MSNINSLAFILFFFKERKLVVVKACDDNFVEKHNQRQKKLKVGVSSTP
jgi:hypothetical protein